MYCWDIANSRLRDQICNIRANAHAAWIQIMVEQKTIELTERRGRSISTNMRIHTYCKVPKPPNLSPFCRHLSYLPPSTLYPFQILGSSCTWKLSQVILCTTEFPLLFYQKQQNLAVPQWLIEGWHTLQYIPTLPLIQSICTHNNLITIHILYL
jgi:hypothetical protein